MSDVTEDKKEFFVIFASKPEKIRVLPGLVKLRLELSPPKLRDQKGGKK